MSNASFEKQFMGQARLVRLLLWKVGDSTDIDICLSTAYEKGMLTDDDVVFLKASMEEEEAVREGATMTIDVDQSFMAHLYRCVDKLNRADCA